MRLQPQFLEFIRAIRPTDRHEEEWKTSSRTLRSRLTQDEDLKDIVVNSFLQGSVRRSTACRPKGDKRSDVDIVIVTDIDWNKEHPQAAMDRFKPFLDKHYKGKWEPQDRSFGITLSLVDLDLVVTALPTDPTIRDTLRRLYLSDAVTTVQSIEERLDWRLSRDWEEFRGPFTTLSKIEEAPEADWRPHPLMLPDRNVGDWGPTHPLAQIRWAAEKNRACNGHYVNVVRSMKWWRLEHQDDLPKYPKGYPLEHMIGSVLPDGIQSIAEGLTTVFETIRDRFVGHVALGVVPVLPDHGVPSHDVMRRVSPEDFAKFHAGVTAAAEKAREALDCDDAAQSGELWQALLGSSFPLPGPRGGDRTRGFETPAVAATPRPSERFA